MVSRFACIIASGGGAVQIYVWIPVAGSAAACGSASYNRARRWRRWGSAMEQAEEATGLSGLGRSDATPIADHGFFSTGDDFEAMRAAREAQVAKAAERAALKAAARI